MVPARGESGLLAGSDRNIPRGVPGFTLWIPAAGRSFPAGIPWTQGIPWTFPAASVHGKLACLQVRISHPSQETIPCA